MSIAYRCNALVLILCAAQTAMAVAQGSPAAAPAPAYGYTFTPSPQSTGTPRILEVDLNTSHLHAGGPIAIRVLTTPDVVKVTSGSGSKSGALGQTGPGVFASQSTLPHIGGLIAKHIKLHFTATTADGKSVSVDVPVIYQ